jgi:hypothetical protein
VSHRRDLRLERIEQAVEAIEIEIERIGSGGFAAAFSITS